MAITVSAAPPPGAGRCNPRGYCLVAGAGSPAAVTKRRSPPRYYYTGTAADLNTLIAPGSGVTLVAANGINNNGDIVGTAVPASNPKQIFGFELIPAGSTSG